MKKNKKYKLFSFHKSNGYLWFRIFGYGLHFKNYKKTGLLFSERYGYVKTLKIFNWSIKILKPQ